MHTTLLDAQRLGIALSDMLWHDGRIDLVTAGQYANALAALRDTLAALYPLWGWEIHDAWVIAWDPSQPLPTPETVQVLVSRSRADCVQLDAQGTPQRMGAMERQPGALRYIV